MSKSVAPLQHYLAADKERALRYREVGRTAATRKSDALIWRRFSSYIGSKDPWKSTPEDVAAWCAHLADAGYSLSFIRGALSSLTYKFMKSGKGNEHGKFGTGTLRKNPIRTPLVRSTMRGIQVVHHRMPKRKTPIMLDTLERLIGLQPDTPTGLRNKALLSLTWAGALRASEVCPMLVQPTSECVSRAEILEEGIRVSVLRKNAPGGELRWETIGIPVRESTPQYCPTRLMQAWLNAYGASKGPLFPAMRRNGRLWYMERIGRHTINTLLQTGIGQLGLPEREYGSRSLRSGCVVWMIDQGVELGRVMQHAGYRSPQSVAHHIASKSAVRLSPLAETSWLT